MQALRGMPSVFVLATFPTMLIASLLIILSLDLSGAAAVSVVLLVAVLGVVFISTVMSMRRQHPSQDGGDRRMSEDRFAPVETELDREEAVPEPIAEQTTARYGAVEPWIDDGAPASSATPR